jgi:osmoprotectant transport system permease protein
MNVFGYLQDGGSWSGPDGILRLLLQHLAYTASAVLLAAVVAIPLGVLIGRTRRGAAVVTGLGHAARSVSSLGLLFLAVMLLGTGAGNIVVVLAILALPVILTAVAVGVASADREAVLAGRALGMTEGQVVRQLEWPLALPVAISGLRRATLQVVATATVAAFASGGGLGRLLTIGQAQNDYPQMFAGAVMIAGLAIVLDLLLGAVGWFAARRARPGSRTAPLPLTVVPV